MLAARNYYKLADGKANTCPEGQNIQTETECQIAFLKVVALETLKASPSPMLTASQHSPPGCSLSLSKNYLLNRQEYLRCWNLNNNGINIGGNYKLCIGSP